MARRRAVLQKLAELERGVSRAYVQAITSKKVAIGEVEAAIAAAIKAACKSYSTLTMATSTRWSKNYATLPSQAACSNYKAAVIRASTPTHKNGGIFAGVLKQADNSATRRAA